MRIVCDTNVMISALMRAKSIPANVVAYAEYHGSILYSAATLAELVTILSKEKFRRYLSMEELLLAAFHIERTWEAVHVIHQVQICRDPKDDIFLELALTGKADFIITGDADLLTLHPYKDCQILTPAAFLEKFSS